MAAEKKKIPAALSVYLICSDEKRFLAVGKRRRKITKEVMQMRHVVPD
jgi:hypothetical protein